MKKHQNLRSKCLMEFNKTTKTHHVHNTPIPINTKSCTYQPIEYHTSTQLPSDILQPLK